MEQYSVESLLRRLVTRIEENERRYGRALDELHARLDQLSHTTETARASSGRDGSATLDRLHDQVSKLARRLEQEASSPLDDFERLGKALSGGMDYSTGASGLDSGAADELGHPRYGSRPPLETPVGTEPPFSFWVPESPHSPPPAQPAAKFSSPSEDRDLDNRLIDVAHRLERSIETTMSTAVLEALNARLDEIGNQINQALLRTPKFPSFEPLEIQISDLAQKLARAEEQFARIGSIESELHGLIARVDASPGDVEEVIGRVAGEAARLAAAEAARFTAAEVIQSTAERLDAMHHDLMTMSDRTRTSDDRLTNSITAVQDSLKQLAQQVEKGASQAQQPPMPRAAFEAVRGETESAEPGPAHHPLAELRIDKGLGGESGSARIMPQAPAKPKTLRTRLTPAAPAREQTKAASALVHTKRLRPTEEAVDLDSPAGRHPLLDAGQDEKFETPTDLIAAARRAAARKPEEEASASDTKSADAGLSQPSIAPGRPLMQNRSLLIVAAAILLAISAAFLYQRLQSKPEPMILPPVIEQSAPAPETPPAQSDSWAPVPQPQNDPNKNAANDGEGGNFTEVTKSSYGSAPPETENAVEPGALGQGEVSLPTGIVFSVEDPSSPAATPAEAAPSPSADPADTPEATNPALIARAQELLNKLGYNVGLVDGEMNVRTRQAIAGFERNNGLQETGKVTIQLVTALERVAS
jgi:localization factor PodJL